MQSLLTYALALFGFCFIVGSSGISLPLREWMAKFRIFSWPLKLIECAACLSFWCGLFCSYFFHAHVIAIVGTTFAHPFIFALFSCGSSAFLGLLTGLIRG